MKSTSLVTGLFKALFNINYLKTVLQSENYRVLKRNLRSIGSGYIEFDEQKYKTFFEENSGKKVLLVSHELSVTGAPNVLLNIAKHFKETNIAPFVITLKEGPMRKNFEALEIPVLLFNITNYNKSQLLPFVEKFDFAIANTVMSYDFVKLFENVIPTVWWLHETNFHQTIFKRGYSFVTSILNNAKNISVGTNYVKNDIIQYNKNIKKLTYFIEEFDAYPKEKSDKINFSIIGSIDKRKAQDIFIEAIIAMPEEYRKKAIFNIVGRGDSFMEKLKDKAQGIDEIIWHGLISSKEAYRQLLSNADVLVCVSRDDPDPVVVTEACMIGVPCIVTKSVGQSEYIKDGENGFVIDTENVEQLKNLMMKIIDNPQMLENISKKTKSVYEENYTKAIFEKRLNEIIS